MEELKVGGFLAGHKLTLDGVMLEWKGVYGHGFKVPIKLVQGVTVEKTGRGYATLKVIGTGTELAKVEKLPIPMAEQAQAWIMQRIAG